MDATVLSAAMTSAFETIGADTPPWPDPHADLDGPRDEEYSRCLDPTKYRIVAARAEAWARALVDCGLAVRDPVADPGTVWNFAALHEHISYPTSERGDWLRPSRPRAIPLLLTLRSVDAPDNHLDIGAGDPAVRLTSVPFCGCDACDSGSHDLIESIDETVLTVVSGALIHITTDAGTIQTTESGWSASGHHSQAYTEQALREARSGRSPHAVVRGEPWW